MKFRININPVRNCRGVFESPRQLGSLNPAAEQRAQLESSSLTGRGISNGIKRGGQFLAILFFFLFFPAPVKADTLGQNQNFSISSAYDIQSRTNINATLKKVSDHAYFYVENNYWDSVSSDMQGQILNQINVLAQEFDSRIYPIETQFFGAIRNIGDGKVTILTTPLIENAGGYYDTANEFPRQQTPASNEREMIYLNIGQLSDQRRIDSFLSHEFQHLITFNQKDVLKNITDDVWLNELRSEYAVTLLGYNDVFAGSNLERRLRSFLENSADSLTEWKNLQADYGQIALFGEYIAEHWSQNAIADTLKSPLIGIPSLEDALSRNGFKDSFKDIFTDWLFANILNDTSIISRFGYGRDGLRNFHIVPSRVLNNLSDDIAFAVSDSIKDWSGRWYDVSQFASGKNNFLRINFSSPSPASFYIPYIVFKPDGAKTASVFNPQDNSNILYLGQIGQDISRVIFMPIKKDKISGFGADEPPVALAFSLDRVESAPQQTVIMPTSSLIQDAVTVVSSLPILPDGSLVRARGDYKVYVIMGRWKRHIINAKIFNFYPQFGFGKVREVDPEFLDKYQESNLVRYNYGARVYIIDESGKKHWLNISAKQFLSSGRSPDSIFSINAAELNFYRTSSNITK